MFLKDHGQTKPKPKPRGAKKLQKLTVVEQEGESKCLFRATNGKKKLSTVVSQFIIHLTQFAVIYNCKPWDYICSKGFFAGLIFGGAYYWKEFCISEWVGLDNKNRVQHYENSLKQLKTANSNSPWAYIREGLLSEGYLHLRFGGLIFGRTFFSEGGGGGGGG